MIYYGSGSDFANVLVPFQEPDNTFSTKKKISTKSCLFDVRSSIVSQKLESWPFIFDFLYSKKLLHPDPNTLPGCIPVAVEVPLQQTVVVPAVAVLQTLHTSSVRTATPTFPPAPLSTVASHSWHTASHGDNHRLLLGHLDFASSALASPGGGGGGGGCECGSLSENDRLQCSMEIEIALPECLQLFFFVW